MVRYGQLAINCAEVNELKGIIIDSKEFVKDGNFKSKICPFCSK